MRQHEINQMYEPLEQAADNAARFLSALIEGQLIPDVVFEGMSGDITVDAPLDPTQPWDAQAQDVRDALLAGLVRTGFAEREARTQVLRARLARAHGRRWPDPDNETENEEVE